MHCVLCLQRLQLLPPLLFSPPNSPLFWAFCHPFPTPCPKLVRFLPPYGLSLTVLVTLLLGCQSSVYGAKNDVTEKSAVSPPPPPYPLWHCLSLFLVSSIPPPPPPGDVIFEWPRLCLFVRVCVSTTLFLISNFYSG